ncbi:MAG: hypothetical protein PHQ28_10920 [Mycobacterium sp.]|nr:hypothetical protein [Mycobacterium sp.]
MSDGQIQDVVRDRPCIESGVEPGFPIVVTIDVGDGPVSGIAASPDGARLVVSSYGHHSVSTIDTDSCRSSGSESRRSGRCPSGRTSRRWS